MTLPRRLILLAALVLGVAACGRGDADPPAALEPAPSQAVTPAPPPATATAPAPAPGPAPVPGTLDDGGVALAMLSVHRMSDTASVTFGGVVDSRCPSDVQCVWAGEAHALFVVSAYGQADTVLALPVAALSHADPALRFRTAAGRRFFLLSLEPVPASGMPVPNEAYVARLRIEPDPLAVMPTQAQADAYREPGTAWMDGDVATPGPSQGPRQEIPGLQDWTRNTVRLHERVALSDTAGMTMAGVLESRCPTHVACAVAGEAEVLFLVTQAGLPAEAVSLKWGDKDFHDPALRYRTVAGHRVMLDAIEPGPDSDEPIPASRYVATLRIDPVPRR